MMESLCYYSSKDSGAFDVVLDVVTATIDRMGDICLVLK